MTSTLPGVASPAAGFDQPFELLAGCHERVRRSLALLQRLATHVAHNGIDAPARSAAHDVLRYFDLAAPLHHQDEERHIVPRLQASADPALQAAAVQMLAEHGRIEALWQALRLELQALFDAVDGPHTGQALARLQTLADAFVAVHQPHLALEDGLVFPRVADLVDAAERQTMGAEMAQRRGVTPPPQRQP